MWKHKERWLQNLKKAFVESTDFLHIYKVV